MSKNNKTTPDGKKSVADMPLPKAAKGKTRLEMIVTYLKMEKNPKTHMPPPVNMKLALMHVENCPVHFYRYLYDTIGADYYWVDRQMINDDALAEEIQAEGVDIYVAYVSGVPAGYFELDKRQKDIVWLAYFGIVPDFVGTGLGKWLLHEAIATAWLEQPETVRVETCTLDHPRALPLYQKYGFVPYERRDKVIEIT